MTGGGLFEAIDDVAALRTAGLIVTACLAGWLAGLVVRGRSAGCVVNILLGIAGGALGNAAAALLRLPVGGYPTRLALAAGGALLLLLALSLLRRLVTRRAPRP